MAKAYSYDLRQKVIQAIELDGMKKSEAAQVFQISCNTIDLWLKRQAKTGDYQPKSTRPHRTSDKITDWKSLLALPSNMETRRKLRWQRCGKTRSVLGRFTSAA
jgi:transposase